MVLEYPDITGSDGYKVIGFASTTWVLHPIAEIDIRGLRFWLGRFTVCMGW